MDPAYNYIVDFNIRIGPPEILWGAVSWREDVSI
jgi:hypothetical protein